MLAWTSDTEGAWTQDFLMWKDGPAFFGGLVTKTLAREAKDGTLEVTTENGMASIRYTLPEGAETPGGAKTQATVLLPDGAQQVAQLTQTEAQVYEGSFPASGQGAYALRVEQKQGMTPSGSRRGKRGHFFRGIRPAEPKRSRDSGRG